jgi:hypothetical protein
LERKSDVKSLYKEIESIDADEEDDKAMGVDIPAEKLNSNQEVSTAYKSQSPMADQQQRTSLTWRATRLQTHSDIRALGRMKGKRDLNILFKPQKEEPKVVEVVEPVTEVKKEDGGGEKVEVTADTEDTDTAVPVSAASEVTDVAENEKEKDNETVEESGKMEVDKTETEGQ